MSADGDIEMGGDRSMGEGDDKLEAGVGSAELSR